MRRVTATREVVNSARRKCSDSISDMVLFSFDVLFLMIVLMIVCFDVFDDRCFDVFDDRFDDLAEPEAAEVRSENLLNVTCNM